jgi:hypothetical protein
MNMKDNTNKPELCPCSECISFAMCKYKQYDIIIKECSIIREHVAKADQPSMRASEFMDVMEGKVTI